MFLYYRSVNISSLLTSIAFYGADIVVSLVVSLCEISEVSVLIYIEDILDLI